MVGPKPSREATLHLTRTFAAPRETIFRAWTDPEELKKWWGPEGYATPTAEAREDHGKGWSSCLDRLAKAL